MEDIFLSALSNAYHLFLDKAFDTFSLLSDLVNASLPEDEFLWFQSIPCILPYWDQIPIAQYSEEGEDSQKYREDLAKKYESGICLVFRLCVTHYHRYIYLDNCEKGDNVFIKGMNASKIHPRDMLHVLVGALIIMTLRGRLVRVLLSHHI